MENTLLSTKSCDTFSILRGNDLLDLLEVVENTLIAYRNTLNLPSKLTFGVEIEYEKVSQRTVSKYIDEHLPNWYSTRDTSLQSGGEINSPILRDEKRTWEELKKICEFLKSHNADTTKNAGGHIHVGAPVIGNNLEGWRIFIKLYTLYEHIIYRFFYGDKINGRPKIMKYAPPVSDELYDILEIFNELIIVSDLEYKLPDDKYYAINFGHLDFYELNKNHDKNTFELRCPNGTTEEIIWQNNINTFARMLLSSGTCSINEDYLNYKLQRFTPNTHDSYRYKEVILKEALEFCDLVFDCNLDKVYFLRQYIKSFERSIQAGEAVLAKRFIK